MRTHRLTFLLTASLGLGVVACSSDSTSGNPAGGTTTSGGAKSGGTTTSSGGSTTNGGSSVSGGSTSSGGASGGTTSTGGSTGATGGSTGATGGSTGATGGSTGATGGSTGATGGSTGATGGTTAAPSKIRLIISSDIAHYSMGEHETDPDDVQSIIRFFAYANYFDIEALVASAGTHANKASTEGFTAILGLYAKVEENLKKHDPGFPSAEALTKMIYKGRDQTWGKTGDLVGDGKDTDASNAVITVVDKTDTRPVWIVIWGGSVEIAQALYKVKKERTADEADKFISKMRVFNIMGQDGSTGYMTKTFPKLFHILSNDFGGMFCDNDRGDKALCNTAWLDANIKSKGPLNAVYPVNCSIVKGGVQEGDSPSFMYLVSSVHPNGTKNNPEDPTMDSWGGKYKKVGDSNFYEDTLPKNGSTDWKNVTKYRETVQKDWADRAKWMVE